MSGALDILYNTLDTIGKLETLHGQHMGLPNIKEYITTVEIAQVK